MQAAGRGDIIASQRSGRCGGILCGKAGRRAWNLHGTGPARVRQQWGEKTLRVLGFKQAVEQIHWATACFGQFGSRRQARSNRFACICIVSAIQSQLVAPSTGSLP